MTVCERLGATLDEVRIERQVLKINPYHEPAGSYHGGEFARKPGIASPMPPPGRRFLREHELVEQAMTGEWTPSPPMTSWAKVMDFSIGVGHTGPVKLGDVLQWDANQLDKETRTDAYTSLARERYIGSGYRAINEVARGSRGNPRRTDGAWSMDYGTAAQHIDNLDRRFATQGVTLRNPVTVYRGLTSRAPAVGWVKGSTWRDLGFLSTSTDPKIAEGWSARNGEVGEVMVITLPRGMRVMGGQAMERELILPRGTKLRFKGRDAVGWLQFVAQITPKLPPMPKEPPA
jgi:hypothetical protein